MKQAARATMTARRRACDPGAGSLLGGHLAASGLVPAGAAVAGYWPLLHEIDIRPVLSSLHEAGYRIALPETPPRGQPLQFRQWHPGATLTPGRFSTLHPDGPAVVPGVLLVPLLAFDRQGNRLGYGGGYYDRTLAALPQARAIGCAFAVQEMDQVPTGPYDEPLDAVATERGVISFRT